MPLTTQEQQELDDLELEKLELERKNRASRAGGSTTRRKGEGASFGTVVDVGLEAGIPMLGQAVTAPIAETGAQAVVGSGLSIIGNVLAQTRRVAMGEQKEFSGGQIAQAAVTGAVPFGPAKNVATSRPVIKGAYDAAKMGLGQAAVGLSGETIKTLIDEGRLPHESEALVSALLPGAIGTGASAAGSLGRGLVTKGRRVAQNVADYGAVTPTPGMMLPEEFAATEQRLAREKPSGDVARKIDTAQTQLARQVQGIAPNPKEGAEIFEAVSPLLGQISKAEDELAKLNESAKAATIKAQQAVQKIRAANAASQKEGEIAGVKEAQRLSDEAFDTNLQSALENAKEIATARLTGGASGLDSATARNIFVEHVAKPIEAAFEEKSAQMYSLVNGEAKVFDPAPIIGKAKAIAAKASGTLPAKLQASVRNVEDMLSAPKEGAKEAVIELVSLQDLRNVRAELLKKVQLGELGSYEEKMIKDVAAEITAQIDGQAATALGKEGGEALKAANKFYRETRPLFDQRGVDVLFSAGTGDEFSRTMLAGMEKAGINSDEFKNLQNLITKIGEFNPELAKSAQAHVQDTLRKSIIFDASRVNPSSATGELTVDSTVLVDRLDKMARVPGTLEALNLGNPAKVAELKKLMGQYPEASKFTPQQWSALMESPVFAEVATGGQLSTLLKPVLAASQAEAQLVKAANLRAGGKIERAHEAYEQALDTVQRINGDVAAARARYEQLLKDPTAIALNNPGIGDKGFNAFADSLFNPAANKLKNADVRAIADALRSDPSRANQALLLRLQERYIADKIAAYHSTPASSVLLEHPDADSMALFFNPSHPTDAANEIGRARALLNPEQMEALEEFSKTAKSIAEYEKLGAVREKPGSYNTPFVGQIRRGLDTISDFYREGKYNVAARMLADPVKFSRIATKVGESTEGAAQAIQTGAQGAGRAVGARQ